MEYMRQVWKNTPALRWFAFVIVIAAGVALVLPSPAPERAPATASISERVRRWIPFLPGGRSRQTIKQEVKDMAQDALSATKDVVKEAVGIAGELRSGTLPPEPGR